MGVAITFIPDINREIPFAPLPETSLALKWLELSVIITGIATVIILSCASVLPAYFLVAAKVSVLTTLINVLLIATLHALTKSKENVAQEVKEHDTGKQHPVVPCIVLPIVEEGIFRGLIQSGLQSLFFKILPATIMCTLPLPTLVAIGISSLLFGAVHIPNNAKWQPITASLKGVVSGILFSHYGLAASIFEHMINNTLISTLIAFNEEKPTNEIVRI